MGNPNRGNRNDQLKELPRIDTGANSVLAPVRAFDGGLP